MSKIQSNHKPQFPKIRALDSWDFLGHWSLAIGTLQHTTYNIRHTAYNKGYALILSIVVSSVVLSIGLSLLNIVQKEIILSATGRDSQFAFYAADGGVECALYWDIGYTDTKAFPENLAETNGNDSPSAPGGAGDSDCGNTDFGGGSDVWDAEIEDGDITYVPPNPNDADPQPSGYEDDEATYTFQITFVADATMELPGSCARVTITKDDPDNAGADDVVTRIESKGYNAECPAGGGDFDAAANPRLVERAISVTY